jgi:hypothetical protein
MLGFVLGALLVWAIERPTRRPAAEEAKAPAAPAAAMAAPVGRVPGHSPAAGTSLSTVENVFAQWGKYAVWDNDATEVAIWNTESRGYDECFEVVRIQDQPYFRSIPHLTHPPLTHGGAPPECPMQFTETEEQRAQWLKENEKAGAEEAIRALGASLGNKPANP